VARERWGAEMVTMQIVGAIMIVLLIGPLLNGSGAYR
jgi:hypothetical protein